MQLIQRVDSFSYRAIDVRQWNASELTEAIGPALNEFRVILIHLPSEVAALRITGQMHAGGAQRKNASGDRLAIHHTDRDLRIPVGCRPAASGETTIIEQLTIGRRNQMLVGVYSGRRCHGTLHRKKFEAHSACSRHSADSHGCQLLMLWTAPPPARECHESGSC